MKKTFDIAVIGGGPGGYVAAIRAARHRKKVVLIEAKELGGTCLNRGCIPSKTLISNAEVLKKIKKSKEFGINTGSISIDFSSMKERKDRVVNSIRSSLERLIAANHITVIKGYGALVSQHEISIDGKEIIEADKIIIATGSEPRFFPPFFSDSKRIHDSTSILELTELPKNLIIIGAGVIGCEFASLYRELGVEITLLEVLPTILATEGEQISSFLSQAFKKVGINIETKVEIKKIELKKDEVVVELNDGRIFTSEMALIAVGRSLNTENIGLEKVGVKKNPNNSIPVNKHLQTNIPNIYAIGDITGQWLLAHFASHQGVAAADHAAGLEISFHPEAVPSVIFTSPEIGTVGYTLDKAKEKGFDAVIGQFPFQALGKSQALMETEGFAQIVTDRKTGQILGAQVVGYGAATLIAQMVQAIQNELTIECIADTIHAHPTISEAWLEASFLALDMPLHWPPKLKK